MNAFVAFEKGAFHSPPPQHIRNNSRISPQQSVINYLANGICLFSYRVIVVARDQQKKIKQQSKCISSVIILIVSIIPSQVSHMTTKSLLFLMDFLGASKQD